MAASCLREVGLMKARAPGRAGVPARGVWRSCFALCASLRCGRGDRSPGPSMSEASLHAEVRSANPRAGQCSSLDPAVVSSVPASFLWGPCEAAVWRPHLGTWGPGGPLVWGRCLGVWATRDTRVSLRCWGIWGSLLWCLGNQGPAGLGSALGLA